MLGLGAFFLVRFVGGGGLHNGGPLAPRAGYTDAVAVPVDVKTPYSWGLIYLDNRGNDDTAHVVAFDLGQVPPGLRVLGSYAQDPFGHSIGVLPGYDPSNGPPVEGLDIPAHGIYEVIVGLSATTQGRHLIPDVRVRYTSGGTRYEATFDQAIVLCAPKAEYMKKGCPSPLD